MKILRKESSSGGRPINGMGGTKTDGDTVPDIDGANGHRDLGDLFVGEMRLERGKVGVGRPGLRQQGQRFGPAENGAFLGGVDRRFLPGGTSPSCAARVSSAVTAA